MKKIKPTSQLAKLTLLIVISAACLEVNAQFTPLNGNTYYNGGNVGIGVTNPFNGTTNKGLHISRGAHTSLLLGDPKNGYGGIIQTSDNKRRIFIGANLYDAESGSWSSFNTGKGSAGISLIADEGGWGTGIDFITSQSDGHYNPSMHISGNGNVGIGTASPGEKLEVSGLIKINRATNQDNNSPGLVAISNDDFLYDGKYINRYGFGFHGFQDGTTSFTDPLNTYMAGYFGLDFFTTNSNRMRISHTGNVGIGTTNPFNGTGNKGLHISRGAHSSLLLGDPKAGYGGIIQTSDNKRRIFIGANLYDDESGSWSAFNAGKGSAGISLHADEGGWGTGIDLITSQSDGHFNSSMHISGNGNVGIGTTTLATGYKLSVAGKIISEEVKVQLQIAWPDYVFSKKYKLASLSDTESYIKEEGHLPNIPSAAEVSENGIELGEMNARLLEKIEELTLHLIEQNKQLEAQNSRIQALEAK